MALCGHDTLKTRRTLSVNGQDYDYFSLEAAGLPGIERLPNSLKVLLENLLRYEDGRSVCTDDVQALVGWLKDRRSDREIAYRPARVLMQDFTGVPAVVDLAAMREAVSRLGAKASSINPLSPVDLVIDHSVMVDAYGTKDALTRNIELEFQRNGERYAFLRWGSKAFANFRVVPPGVGICHQVNLEYLARVVWTGEDQGRKIAFPDTLVGTDSHTTMVNGLGVLGWGVGGIEAEAAMLGQPVSMLIPEVVGFKLTGALKEGTTATDLVLTVTQMLRARGVVGKFVEFYGDGLDHLPLADRATIANMAPEYGATCGFFPVDTETLRYLRFTGRDEDTVALVEAYAKAQGLWRDKGAVDPDFTDTLCLDMGTVEPSMAGPSRPQDRVLLKGADGAFKASLRKLVPGCEAPRTVPVTGRDYKLEDGSVVIAAITSCTNTSNPSVMMAAGLLAKKAVARGLKSQPWVKTSLAPGSQVVADYLEKAGVQDALDALGFNIAGFGCTTCIGNSGPLDDDIGAAIDANGLVAAAVLSGNRNFEGRIHSQVRASYLASPPLVVAYALAGSLNLDLTKDPIGQDSDGADVYLKDIWPTSHEIADAIAQAVTPQMYRDRYGFVFEGSKEWQAIHVGADETYAWQPKSTYVRNPPYFEGMEATPKPVTDIIGARPLAILGDSVTTDHISPAGSIKADSPAGRYLKDHGVAPADFNSYGSRRGNHEVMMRGTFANIRIRNKMVPGVEGGVTAHQPSGQQMAIFDAAMVYQKDAVPLVVIGGTEYGTGSSRDWAAKGTTLLGVRAVIVESFERIHRSNLVGMGILPLQFAPGLTAETLGLVGTETFDIRGLTDIKPRQKIVVTVHRADGTQGEFETICRIDTLDELDYYRNGGILQTVLRNIAKA